MSVCDLHFLFLSKSMLSIFVCACWMHLDVSFTLQMNENRPPLNHSSYSVQVNPSFNVAWPPLFCLGAEGHWGGVPVSSWGRRLWTAQKKPWPLFPTTAWWGGLLPLSSFLLSSFALSPVIRFWLCCYEPWSRWLCPRVLAPGTMLLALYARFPCLSGWWGGVWCLIYLILSVMTLVFYRFPIWCPCWCCPLSTRGHQPLKSAP